MSDGTFPSKVSATRADNSAGNPIYITLVDAAGDQVVVDASGFLTVNVNGTVTVSATDLDIRDLSETTDHVLVFANTAKDGTGTDYVPLVDADGHLQVDILSGAGGTEYTEDDVAPAAATGNAILAERDDALSAITPVEGDWSKLYCSANGALWVSVDGTVTVSATDLDIRDIVHTTDSVALGDGSSVLADFLTGATIDALQVAITDGTENVAVNTDGSINVNIVSATVGGEVHDYEEEVDVASDSSSNHDYTVTATKTLILKGIIVSGSGSFKYDLYAGPVASLVQVATGFSTGRQGDTQVLTLPQPVEVPDTSTGTVRLTLTNRQGSAVSIYSTIIGEEI